MDGPKLERPTAAGETEPRAPSARMAASQLGKYEKITTNVWVSRTILVWFGDQPLALSCL